MKLRGKISGVQYAALSGLGLLMALGVWSAFSYSEMVPSFFLPTPTAVWSALASLLGSGGLLTDIGASIYRIATGCLLSLAVALPLGVALGVSRRFEAFAEPLVAFVRYIPPSAFIPLAIIWFGIGEVEKVAILFVAVAPYLALLIADAVLCTRRELVDVARTLGASRSDVILKVIIPHALPGMWDALRIMVGAAWTFVIIAEIVGASSGLGHLMVESQRFLRTDNIFAGLVVIGLLGLATDYCFKFAYHALFPWTEKSHA